MPISLGKHVKQTGAHVRGSGRHAAAIEVRYSFRQIVLCVVLALAVIVVPFSFNKLLVAFGNDIVLEHAHSAQTPVLTSASEAIVSKTSPDSFVVLPELFDPKTHEVSEIMGSLSSVAFTDCIQAQSQNEIMAGGCELVALDIALDAMGLNSDIHHLVAHHLVRDGHFATGYSGNPYYAGGGYPLGIVDAANGYLLELGSGYQAHNLTGKSFELIKALIAKGYPVLVWTTKGFEDPHFTGAFDNGFEWYSNEHCVVMYGLCGDKVLVSDPLEGLIECDLQQFVEIYEACGNMAVAIY